MLELSQQPSNTSCRMYGTRLTVRSLTLIYLNRINPGLAASGRQKSNSDGWWDGEALIALKDSSGRWRRCSEEECERVETQHSWATSDILHLFNSLEKKPCCLLGKLPGLLQYMPERILHEIHAVWILVKNKSTKNSRLSDQVTFKKSTTCYTVHTVNNRIANIDTSTIYSGANSLIGWDLFLCFWSICSLCMS